MQQKREERTCRTTCTQREKNKRKVRNEIEIELTASGGESDESRYKIDEINKITDRNKYLTATVKVTGIEKVFMMDSG